MRAVACGVAVLGLAAAGPAWPAECAAPCLAYALTAELEDDWIFAARPSSLRANDLYPTLDAELALVPADDVRLVAALTAESVLDPEPGEDRAFADIGAYVEELHAVYEGERVSLLLGKFNPVFGLASGELDGLRATDLADAYDADERWGAQAGLGFEALGLKHSLTANLFTTDRTVLSRSLFTDRGRTRLSDGGAGNSDGLSSLGAILAGCRGEAPEDCYEDGAFGYWLGLRHQQAGRASEEQKEEGIVPRDELSVLAAASASRKIGEATLRVLAETAYVENLEGEPRDALIGTIGVELERNSLTYMAAYSRQRDLTAGAADAIPELLDLTINWEIGEGSRGALWYLTAGYSCQRDEAGEITHTVGVVLGVDIEGEVGR